MERYGSVKVFSATKSRDRAELDGRITRFLRESGTEVVGKEVRLTSDREFHCLTIVLFLR